MRRRFAWTGLGSALAILMLRGTVLAQKTDVLEMLNHDRITGEIKYYQQGKLTIDSVGGGWISVKWNHLLSITSDKEFDVQTIDGLHHYGTLAASDPPGRLMIVSGPQTVTVSFFEVFTLATVYQTFWKRWEGSLGLGFNYTQSNNLTQFNLAFDGKYRMKKYALVTGLTSFFSRQEGVTSAERGAIVLAYERYFEKKWLFSVGFGLDRNIQLGLKLRTSVGGAVGRFVVQTNQAQLVPLLGIVTNREEPVSGESTYNTEIVVGCRYDYFMYEFPKLTIGANVEVYPNLTDTGRVRLEANASVKREIVNNFYLTLSIFDSFDSRDPSTGQAVNDWGPTISVGWQF